METFLVYGLLLIFFVGLIPVLLLVVKEREPEETAQPTDTPQPGQSTSQEIKSQETSQPEQSTSQDVSTQQPGQTTSQALTAASYRLLGVMLAFMPALTF